MLLPTWLDKGTRSIGLEVKITEEKTPMYYYRVLFLLVTNIVSIEPVFKAQVGRCSRAIRRVECPVL